MDWIFNLQLTNWGHIEYRESPDKPWHHVTNIDIDRAQVGTTCLFGIGDEFNSAFSPVAPDRGIPDDVSDPTRTAYEHAGDQSGQMGYRFGQTVLRGEDIAQTDWEAVSPSNQTVVRPQGAVPDDWAESSSYEGGWKKSNLFVISYDLSDDQEAALAHGETIDYTIPDDQTLTLDPSVDDPPTVELRRYNRWDNCGKWCDVIEQVRDLAEQYGDSNARIVVWFTPGDKHPSIDSV